MSRDNNCDDDEMMMRGGEGWWWMGVTQQQRARRLVGGAGLDAERCVARNLSNGCPAQGKTKPRSVEPRQELNGKAKRCLQCLTKKGKHMVVVWKRTLKRKNIIFKAKIVKLSCGRYS